MALIPMLSRADDSLDARFQRLGTTYHSIRIANKDFDLKATQYLNEHGDREVVYQFDRNWLMRFLVGSRRSVLVVGRDTDGDRKFDAWFVMGRSGVSQVLDRQAAEPDGWDIAAPLFEKNKQALGNRLFLDILFNNLSFTGGTVDGFFENVDRFQIDLHDLEIRTDRMIQVDKGSQAARANYRIISEEWAALGRQIDRKANGIWKWIALDVTATHLTTHIGKWAEDLYLRFGPKIETLQSRDGLTRVLTEYLQGLRNKSGNAAERVGKKAGALSKGKEAVEHAGSRLLLKMTMAQRLDIAIRGMRERAKVAKLMSAAMAKSFQFIKSGAKEWKYITLTQGAQLGIEMYDKRDAIFTSQNPLIIAKNVTSNKDLVQDVWYMTNETFFMAAAWGTIKNPFKRFGFCAVLSFVDSMAMNYLVKGVTDQKRLAQDVGWELVIGNAQTSVIDNRILNYFEARAANLSNPKLVLLGYVGTLVEQSIGYVAYAAVTDKPKPSARKKLTVQWVPVFGEAPSMP